MSSSCSDKFSTFAEDSYNISEDEVIVEALAMYSLIKADMKSFQKTSKKTGKRLRRPTKAENRVFVAATLNDLEEEDQYRELVLVVSGYFDQIEFHAPPNIKVLLVMRCGFGSNAGAQLSIDDASTFKDVELGIWSAKRRRGRNLLFGPNVGIRIDPGQKHWDQAQQKFYRSFSHSEKDDINSHFEKMSNARMKGRKWWKTWRAGVAAILGIVCCGMKFDASIKAASGGVFFHYQYGIMSIKAGAAYAKATAAITAAGPALLVGAGVAAVVYFMPWDKLLSWLGGVLSWLRAGIMTLWTKFKDWLASFVQGQQDGGWDERPRARMPRLMKF
ncbi:uncharacterized protein CTRU02_211367 [Colletotrichum truncatum]|uniref:Uncharacterized protein n=1 Tax=Colletotrichum truncatum TaxID=5467 RepID=A0ACC3YRJ0_COLTU